MADDIEDENYDEDEFEKEVTHRRLTNMSIMQTRNPGFNNKYSLLGNTDREYNDLSSDQSRVGMLENSSNDFNLHPRTLNKLSSQEIHHYLPYSVDKSNNSHISPLGGKMIKNNFERSGT